MSIYIIRPRKTSVAHSLKLTSRKFTRENRVTQVAEVVSFWQEDPVYQEIESYLKDTDTITQYPTETNITGAKIVDIPDQEVDRIRQDLPNAIILRDQPIKLIQPERNTAGTKNQLDGDDIWHLDAIALNLARQQGFTGTGKGVTVAVLDTGIEATHTALQGKIAESYIWNPRINNIEDTSAQDTDGHGTHVAGLICGNQIGVAPETQVLNCIVFPRGVGKLSELVLWLNWIAENKPEVSILNISAGFRDISSNEVNAINTLIEDTLISMSVLPVCAVGNFGINQTVTPANCRTALSVGAIDSNYKVAALSSSGTISLPPHLYTVPYLVAPGKGVYSSVMGGGYAAWNGTSMATPIVAGVAALILEKYQNISYLDLLDALLSTCKNLGVDKERQGKGLVQIPTALYES